jgi:hypothetical protein
MLSLGHVRHEPDLSPLLRLMADDPLASRARPVRRRFLQLVRALEQQRARYAVCGAVALGAHGLRRFTEDIDVLVDARDVEKVIAALSRSLREIGREPKGGVPHQVKLRSRRARGKEGVDIDLLVPVDAIEQWALETAVRARAFGSKFDVASPEALIVLKLRAHLSEPESPAGYKHFGDAAALIHAVAIDKAKLRKLAAGDPRLLAVIDRALGSPPDRER